MIIRRLKYCALIFSLTLTLTGCGGGDDAPAPSGPTASSLPPDPGDAGKQTLSGIDSDGDGVRDDIQIALDSLEFSSTEEESSATMLAKGVQTAIEAGISGSSDDAVRSAAEQLALAVDCASHVFGFDASDQILMMELLALNTDERVEAYEHFNAQTEGQQFGAMYSQEVACE